MLRGESKPELSTFLKVTLQIPDLVGVVPTNWPFTYLSSKCLPPGDSIRSTPAWSTLAVPVLRSLSTWSEKSDARCVHQIGITSFYIAIWPDVCYFEHNIADLMQMSFPLTHKVLVLSVRRSWHERACDDQGLNELHRYIHN